MHRAYLRLWAHRTWSSSNDPVASVSRTGLVTTRNSRSGAPRGGCELVRVPAVDEALVDPIKVRDYILAPEHPVGRRTARFFGTIIERNGHFKFYSLANDI